LAVLNRFGRFPKSVGNVPLLLKAMALGYLPIDVVYAGTIKMRLGVCK
jgi:hypothetical protein